MTYDNSPGIQALWVAESNWTPDSGVKLHAHDGYYHMFLVREGAAEFTVGKDSRVLQKGMAILAAPGTVHGLINSSDSLVSTYEIKFTSSSPSVLRQLHTLPGYLPASPLSELMAAEIVREGARQEINSQAYVSDYLIALLDYYCRYYGRREKSDTAVVDTSGFSETSKKIVRYLEANYNREIPLQEVATAVGFNKNYICSVFKKDAGMTIGACHTLIRIRRAAEMISFSDMDLMQVSQSTGFVSISHFNRVFKKVVGLPPGQYRRMFPSGILIEDRRPEIIETLKEQNGFIAAIVSRKKMSIQEILEKARIDLDGPKE